jgi:DoxX-like family
MATETNASTDPATEVPVQRQEAGPAKGRLWTGRVLSTLVILFLLFDAGGKLMMPPSVVEAFQRLGFPTSLGPGLGIVMVVTIAVYAIPRTAVFGAVLLTGFLGGAVAIQLRAGSPLFETIFPVMFGVLVWAGILLRECRLREIFPLIRR